MQSPNLPLIGDLPILRLPVELTLIIFGHCSSDIKARLSLSHTCRHWMSIMAKAGALWTDIQIIVDHQVEGRLFESLISLLELQLDRAAGQPLDVIWATNQISAFDPGLMNLLRRKAPFSQWRTLEMQFHAVHPDDPVIFHPGDAFSNLESITIFPSIRTSIIEVLNRTTTSKLEVLDYHPTILSNEATLSDCTGMLARISCLKTSASTIGSLPSNITRLDTSNQRSHSFPHLTTYNIRACIFESIFPIDLRCLEILNVTALLILPDTEVFLPALRHLTCGTIHSAADCKINSPLLESMHISRRRLDHMVPSWVDHTEEAIRHEGFLFSPSRSLTVESVLPFKCILKLLERSPRVERVSLGFGNEECAMQVLECLGGATSEDDSEGTRLCGRLRELRLTFLWDKRDVESWKERAARVVMSRIGKIIMLRILATWKGEGVYVLLA